MSYFMWSGALGSSDVLLSYPTTSIASPITNILISAPKYPYLYVVMQAERGCSAYDPHVHSTVPNAEKCLSISVAEVSWPESGHNVANPYDPHYNLYYHSKDSKTSSNEHEKSSANARRMMYPPALPAAAYVRGVSMDKTLKVFHTHPFLDRDEQTIAVKEVCFNELSPQMLHWLFVLQVSLSRGLGLSLSLGFEGLFLDTSGNLCNVECSIRQLSCYSIIFLNITSIAHEQYTDIYPLKTYKPIYLPQNLSDKLPNSRFGHPREMTMKITVDTVMIGTQPEPSDAGIVLPKPGVTPEESASTTTGTGTASVSKSTVGAPSSPVSDGGNTTGEGYSEADIDVDKENEKDKGGDNKQMIFSFKQLAVVMKKAPFAQDTHFSVSAQTFEIHLETDLSYLSTRHRVFHVGPRRIVGPQGARAVYMPEEDVNRKSGKSGSRHETGTRPGPATTVRMPMNPMARGSKGQEQSIDTAADEGTENTEKGAGRVGDRNRTSVRLKARARAKARAQGGERVGVHYKHEEWHIELWLGSEISLQKLTCGALSIDLLTRYDPVPHQRGYMPAVRARLAKGEETAPSDMPARLHRSCFVRSDDFEILWHGEPGQILYVHLLIMLIELIELCIGYHIDGSYRVGVGGSMPLFFIASYSITSI